MVSEQNVAFLELIQNYINSKSGDDKLLTVETREEDYCTNGESSKKESVVLLKTINIVNEFEGFLRVGEGEFRYTIADDRVRVRCYASGMSTTMEKVVRVSF